MMINAKSDKIENMRNSKRIGSLYSSMRRRRKSGRVGLFENSRIWNPLHRRISIPTGSLATDTECVRNPFTLPAINVPLFGEIFFDAACIVAIENIDYWCWLWCARNWIQIRYFIIGEQIFVDWLEIWWRRYFRIKVFSIYLT